MSREEKDVATPDKSAPTPFDEKRETEGVGIAPPAISTNLKLQGRSQPAVAQSYLPPLIGATQGVTSRLRSMNSLRSVGGVSDGLSGGDIKITVSVATSLDGYMDDLAPGRLRLSSDEDWAEVLALRARFDAILVGAGTVRADNPSLVIRDPEMRAARLAAGRDADIMKVTISHDLDLDPAARFFTEGAGRKVVFVPAGSDVAVVSATPDKPAPAPFDEKRETEGVGIVPPAISTNLKLQGRSQPAAVQSYLPSLIGATQRVTSRLRSMMDSLRSVRGVAGGLSGVDVRLVALRAVAEVIELPADGAPPRISPRTVVDALAAMGCRSVMVEGGGQVLREFFAAGVVDELRLAVAPVTVDQPGAPRFDTPGNLLLRSEHLAGETAVSWYDVARTDDQLLLVAVRESEKCPPSPSAYSVGAVIVTRSRQIFKGYSRETAPHNHAEEEALGKALAAGATLEGATIYSSLEPCSERASKRVSCSQHIIDHRFARVVYVLDEPERFVRGHGRALLCAAGIGVTLIADHAQMVKDINRHLLCELRVGF